MEIINALEAREVTNAHGVSARTLHSTEHVQVVMITLEPSEALKLHLTPVDVFFYVLEGEGVVEIGGEQEAVHKDQLIISPAKIPHHLWNESDATFRFLVVKTPRQKEESRLL
jgi:mannose-6-phosphate isomerase-like protein (cupin superfamily)